MVLMLVGTPLRRCVLAVLAGVIGGLSFAEFTHRHYQWPYKLSVLEVGPMTNYISRYLGIPDREPTLEVDPLQMATMPNTDRFYRRIATRVKSLVGDPRTMYGSFVRAMGWNVCASGWPFVSRAGCYRVDVYEDKRFDGRSTAYHTFLVDENGLPPERPWGWIGNAAIGGGGVGGLAFGLLTWLAIRTQRALRPGYAFPVIMAYGRIDPPRGGGGRVCDRK